MRKVSPYLFYVATTWFVLPLAKIKAANPFSGDLDINLVPTDPDKSPVKNFADLVTNSIDYGILLFVGIGATLFILFGSIKYITSGGDETKAAAARKTIINAVIGLIITICLWLIWGIAKKIDFV